MTDSDNLIKVGFGALAVYFIYNFLNKNNNAQLQDIFPNSFKNEIADKINAAQNIINNAERTLQARDAGVMAAVQSAGYSGTADISKVPGLAETIATAKITPIKETMPKVINDTSYEKRTPAPTPAPTPAQKPMGAVYLSASATQPTYTAGGITYYYSHTENNKRVYLPR